MKKTALVIFGCMSIGISSQLYALGTTSPVGTGLLGSSAFPGIGISNLNESYSAHSGGLSDKGLATVAGVCGAVLFVGVAGAYVKHRMSDQDLLDQEAMLERSMGKYNETVLNAKVVQSLVNKKRHALSYASVNDVYMSEIEQQLLEVADCLGYKAHELYESVHRDFAMIKDNYNRLWWRSFRVKSVYTDSAIGAAYGRMKELFESIKSIQRFLEKHRDFCVGMEIVGYYESINTDIAKQDMVGFVRSISVERFPLAKFVDDANANLKWIASAITNTMLCTLYPHMIDSLKSVQSTVQHVKQLVMSSAEYTTEKAEQIAYDIKMRELAIQQEYARAAATAASAASMHAYSSWSKARTYQEEVDLQRKKMKEEQK